jgi:hypothetical protein
MKTQIPPASAAWYISFNLMAKTAEILRYHTTKVDGIQKILNPQHVQVKAEVPRG